jgi:glycosyltransferase involved in cell wall biosynthesis
VGAFLNSCGTCLAQVTQVESAVPVAVVMTSFEPGGTERQMTELVRRLDPARWEVHLACFRTTGRWFERAAERAVSVGEFPVTSFMHPSIVRHVWDFARWCRRRRIAIVQATEIYSNIFALPAAALGGVAVRVGSRRGLNSDRSRAQVSLQRLAYASATNIVANSRASASQLRAEGVAERKIAVVPNGLDLGAYASPARRERLRNIAVVANLRWLKGHDVLIDAAVDILRSVPDARFDLIGEGPERASLIARAAGLGVEHAFTFSGHCADVPARLAAADLFVLPSRTESFPNAILEAMAAGLPVVASGVGGILELIEHERTGWLVPAGDAKALASRLVNVMAAPGEAARIAAAARADVVARFSFERMVAAFDEIYETELARRGVVAPGRSQLAVS